MPTPPLPALPRRVTELREPLIQQPESWDQFMVGSANYNISLPTHTPTSVPGVPAQHEIAPSGPQRLGPGRPGLQLPLPFQRALLTLYLLTTLPLQRIYEAVKDSGGPGRGTLRRFFEQALGVPSEHLSKVRLKDPDLVKKRDEEVRRAYNASRQLDLGFADSEFHNRDPSGPRKKARLADELSVHRTGYTGTPALRQSFIHPVAESSLQSDNGVYLRNFTPPESDAFQVPHDPSDPHHAREHLDDYQHDIPARGLKWADQAQLPSRPSDVTRDEMRDATFDPDEVPAKRKSPMKTFSFGKLAEKLNGGKGRSIYLFLTSTLAEHRDTIASRLSSKTSLPCTRTLESDFYLYYYNRRPEDIDAISASTTPADLQTVRMQSIVGWTQSFTAVDILLEAWMGGEGDRWAVERLNAALPATLDAKQDFVNRKDHRGVSPIHLATAYGFIKSCCFLLDNDAEVKTKTSNHEDIRSFSRPARRLARCDIPLYGRIIRCRESVPMGKKPPTPSRWETRDKSRGKSRKEQSQPPAALRHPSPAFHIGPDSRTTTNADSINRSRESINSSVPQYAPTWTDSPTPTFNRNPSLPWSDYSHVQDSFDGGVFHGKQRWMPLTTVNRNSQPIGMPGSVPLDVMTLSSVSRPNPPVPIQLIGQTPQIYDVRHKYPTFENVADNERDYWLHDSMNSGVNRMSPQIVNGQSLWRHPFHPNVPLSSFDSDLAQIRGEQNPDRMQAQNRLPNMSMGPAHDTTTATLDFAHMNSTSSQSDQPMGQRPIVHPGHPSSYLGDYNSALMPAENGHQQLYMQQVPQSDIRRRIPHGAQPLHLDTTIGNPQGSHHFIPTVQNQHLQQDGLPYNEGVPTRICLYDDPLCQGDYLCNFCSHDLWNIN